MKEDLAGKTIQELEQILKTYNQPKFRAEQIFYELQNGKTLQQMSNIPKPLCTQLLSSFTDIPVSIEKVKTSRDGTQKFLFALADGNIVEGVLMNYKFGHTLCVSTQVGCAMHCKFCASGLDGLIRNLTSGEIMGQVIVVNRFLGGDARERKVTNIVLMGSGEPLANFDNVTKFFALATDKNGLNFSERNISLSTCGLADKIRLLADMGRQINLSISLHAQNDEIRRQIMPIAKSFSIEEILSACKYYAEKTNRRILFEYIMIKDVNSSREDALQLAKKLHGLDCIVNLINLNEVKESDLKSCSMEVVDAFAKVLKSYGINVTTRRSLGNDIDGACGQLRRNFLKSKPAKPE
jgi:23S rRNA (adenine2503-C2)-methyltransferase